MPLRRTYALIYFGITLASLLLGYFARPAYGFILFLVGRMLPNFWYADKLNVPTLNKVLVTIFTSVGFFALMGYTDKLIPAIKLIENTFKLYEANFKKFVSYCALFFAATVGFAGLIILAAATFATVPAVLVVLVAVVAWIYTATWSISALIISILKAINGQPLESVKETLILVQPRIWKYLGLEVLKSIIFIVPALILAFITIGSLVSSFASNLSLDNASTLLKTTTPLVFIIWTAYFIFFAWFRVRLSFARFTFFNEQISITDALKNTVRMTAGQWWYLVWRLMIVVVMAGIVGSIISAALSLLQSAGTTGYILSSILSGGVQLVLLPFTLIANGILFSEMKRNANL